LLKIYHAPRTRSVRIVWLLEELGLPYDMHKLAFDPSDLQDPSYLAVNPLGLVPTLEDDGLVLSESGAITQYLLGKYGAGRLEPTHGTPQHARHLYWLHLAEATMMTPLVNIFQHTFRLPEQDRAPKAFLDYSHAKLRAILALIEAELQDRDFICGRELTAADIMLGYNIHFARMLQIPLDDYPAIKAWYPRLRARPGFQKAAAK
jgi:glutathione S-transferase